MNSSQNKIEKDEIMETKVQKIMSDINAYEQAIEDAQNALATAEQELADELEGQSIEQ